MAAGTIVSAQNRDASHALVKSRTQLLRRPLGTSGAYRTVCVRLCDGFHWPISHATTRERFARDADRCEQACPGRSRLFVHRSSDDEPAAMKDLEGHPYAKLENAFRHQREYVSDCTCRGNPWDEEARARHRAYAEAAQAERRRWSQRRRSRAANSGRAQDGNAMVAARRGGRAAAGMIAPGTMTEPARAR